MIRCVSTVTACGFNAFVVHEFRPRVTVSGLAAGNAVQATLTKRHDGKTLDAVRTAMPQNSPASSSRADYAGARIGVAGRIEFLGILLRVSLPLQSSWPQAWTSQFLAIGQERTLRRRLHLPSLGRYSRYIRQREYPYNRKLIVARASAVSGRASAFVPDEEFANQLKDTPILRCTAIPINQLA